MEKVNTSIRQLPNKYLYAGFLIAAVYYLIAKDFSSAATFGGIGLAFDPFNQTMRFMDRPLWQRIWLVVHIVFVFVLIGLSIWK